MGTPKAILRRRRRKMREAVNERLLAVPTLDVAGKAKLLASMTNAAGESVKKFSNEARKMRDGVVENALREVGPAVLPPEIRAKRRFNWDA